jgi:autotransporter-associated beta strand protein
MITRMFRPRAGLFLIIQTLLLLSAMSLLPCSAARAGSATWNLNPATGDWNTAANWTPMTVPNGPSDVATFAASNAPGVTLSAASTEVAEIVFNPGASAFNITVPALTQGSAVLTVSGVGLVNNSSATQNFTLGSATSGGVGTLDFENTATAGTNAVYTAWGAHGFGASPSVGNFHQNSTADSATFIAQGATKGLDVDGGGFGFVDNSTAGDANFTINGAYAAGGSGGGVGFNDFSTAGNAAFVLNPGTTGDLAAGGMDFRENATAGNGVFILNGATTCCTETEIDFTDTASAGDGLFTVMGGQQSNGLGGMLFFNGFTFTGLITTAGNATITNEGGIAAGTQGGLTTLSTSSTAGQALITANGGENGGGPGSIDFFNDSDGGQAQIEVYGDGNLDISSHFTPGVTIGSLAGDGFVFLGSNNLTVGSNNLSSTFSGILQENGGIVHGRDGSLTKIGTATLTLSGASSYTGGTTVSGGTLRVKNTSGSATGTGAVSVNAGTLGGSGIIAGAVTLGAGGGTGAVLQPSKGESKPTTLTIQSALTFQSDSTYVWKLNTRKGRADQVIANGVTINSGASFNLRGQAQGTLTQGLVFTVIKNTGATPIAGTFNNLPDGAIVSVNGNNLQASYEGGDGNDLTLTVVP